MSRIAPIAALIFSIVVVAFLGGTVTAHFKVFPYPDIARAGRSLWTLFETQWAARTYFGERIAPTGIAAKEAPGARWNILDDTALRHPVIVNGGLNQFLETCPGQGCLAVAFDPRGKVIRAWPYRPDDIFAVDKTNGAYPHEMVGFDPPLSLLPVSMHAYPDGDLLATFQALRGAFPFGMGVARLGPDGRPRWTRFDYSHHWATPGADGIAWVPSLKIGVENLRYTLGSGPSAQQGTLECETGHPQLDIVQAVDGAGAVVAEMDLVQILLTSNWVGLLRETTDFCDPLHLNFIDVIRADAGPGLTPGDLVVSLRNLSRFAIIDREKRTIKRVVSGGFVQQHSVHHLSGTRFLIFDNHGGDAAGPASRVVELDLATGAERRIFPNAGTPAAYREVFSDVSGHLDISPDRRRVLASFSYAGQGFEIDIASGRLLAVYDNVHDISSVPRAPEEDRTRAARFSLHGMSYLPE